MGARTLNRESTTSASGGNREEQERYRGVPNRHRGSARGSNLGLGMNSSLRKTLGLLAGLVCIAAGVYLLSAQSPRVVGLGGTSWFEVLAHGIGVYFIGKGVFVWLSVWGQAEQSDHLAKLVELEALRHQRESRG